MTAQSKPKTEDAAEASKSDGVPEQASGPKIEEGSQDEIEQIMSEIEELQQEMNVASSRVDEPLVDVNKESNSSEVVPDEIGHPLKPLASVPPLPPPLPPESPDPIEQEILKDFSGGGEEPWLEETLASLKSEPSSSPIPAQIATTRRKDFATLDQQADALERELSVEKEAVERMINENQPQEPSFGSAGTITLSVVGNIAVRLNYGSEGHHVMVSFSDHAMNIQLSDGTELKVPLRK